MNSIAIRPERPDHPAAMALLDALDRYLGGLYEPEANHILDLQALRRGPFGGYPDNGLSVFMEKRL